MNPDEKECPVCAEVIKAKALKCRFCGYVFPADAPAALPPFSSSFPELCAPFPPETPVPVAIAEGEILDVLGSLVEKSLVIFEEDTSGRGRYRLLESVRAYGRKLLEMSVEMPVIQSRHRDHFAHLAALTCPKLFGSEQAEWLSVLETEHENIRTALDYCLNSSDGAQPGLQMAGALARFWEMRGHLYEGRQWLSAILSREDAQERTRERAEALNGAGVLAFDQGDHVVALPFYEESLAIRRELGEKRGIATSLIGLGIVSMVQGDYEAARAHLEESLEIQREWEPDALRATVLGNLGIIHAEQENYAAARRLFEESLTTYRTLQDKFGIATSLNYLANVTCEMGEYAAAQLLYEQSLALLREIGDKYTLTSALSNLAQLATHQGDSDRAIPYLVENLSLCKELGNKRDALYGLEAMAQVALARGQHSRVVVLLAASAALRSQFGMPAPPKIQAGHSAKRERLRAAMREEAFTAAQIVGAAMTLEQAIAYALQDPIAEGEAE